MNLSPEQRVGAVFEELGLVPATHAASGRYQRSVPIIPGVRYWATSQPRLRRDFLGVQFYGEGAAEAARYGERLTRAGFKPRTPQTGQITFAKPAAFGPEDAIDTNAIRSIRRDLDDILHGRSSRDERPETTAPASFRDFMLASPLAGDDLHIPKRPANWREVDL